MMAPAPSAVSPHALQPQMAQAQMQTLDWRPAQSARSGLVPLWLALRHPTCRMGTLLVPAMATDLLRTSFCFCGAIMALCEKEIVAHVVCVIVRNQICLHLTLLGPLLFYQTRPRRRLDQPQKAFLRQTPIVLSEMAFLTRTSLSNSRSKASTWTT